MAHGDAERGYAQRSADYADRALAYVAVVTEDGYTIGVADAHRRGYCNISYPVVATYDEACVWAEDLNREMGITPSRATDIVIASMFGRGAL
jgi:hypothetical protein